MLWYEVGEFKERVVTIEQLFVEMAANEDALADQGFRFALELPSLPSAMQALATFNEDFSALRRFMRRMDGALAEELEQLEAQGKLVEQVSLVALRLRMAQAERPKPLASGFMEAVLSAITTASAKRRRLVGEEPISLHKTIINLSRLRGLAGTFYEYLANRTVSDDEVFKPSNVEREQVVEHIDNALAEIRKLPSVSPKELERIEGYLLEAKKEALSSTPCWSKIVGALVIAAAVTSGLADAPAAAKHIRGAIEYILGTSVTKTLQRVLPKSKPSDDEGQLPGLVA